MTDRAADDGATIKRRMEELEKERRMASDIDTAAGEWLDMWGARYNCPRSRDGEPDYNYRPRIKEAMK